MEGGPLARPIDEYLPGMAKVFEQHGVVLAYLYGSQARGDAGPLSDIDIAVLFDAYLSKLERARRRVAVTSLLTSVLGRQDVFVADLADATPLLRNEVRREGRVLYLSDDAVRVEFEVIALRDYVDTAPMRRLRQEYLMERIGRGDLGRYQKRVEVGSDGTR